MVGNHFAPVFLLVFVDVLSEEVLERRVSAIVRVGAGTDVLQSLEGVVELALAEHGSADADNGAVVVDLDELVLGADFGLHIGHLEEVYGFLELVVVCQEYHLLQDCLLGLLRRPLHDYFRQYVYQMPHFISRHLQYWLALS